MLKDLQKCSKKDYLWRFLVVFTCVSCACVVCVTFFLPVGLSTVFTEDVNVKKWVPDVPQEYFHLPGPEEKLDFLRLAKTQKR